MNAAAVADELQLIRAIAVLATDAVDRAEDEPCARGLAEARIALRHVELRLTELQSAVEARPLKAVQP